MAFIVALTGIQLAVPRIDEVVRFYTQSFGLDQVGSDAAGTVLSGAWYERGRLQLTSANARALVAIDFALDPEIPLDAHAETLARQGATVEMSGAELRLFDPDGTLLRLRHDLGGGAPQASGRPLYISHLVVNSADSERLLAFYRDVLGFRVADAYEKGLLTFLRCDQKQHHCLGISPAPRSGLNHFAMDCGDIDAVMTCVGRMKQTGAEPIWGPGRHGPGGNVFCYFEDPAGFVPEFTCDVLQIEDDDEWLPKIWDRTPANGNVWGTGGPSPRAVALMGGEA